MISSTLAYNLLEHNRHDHIHEFANIAYIAEPSCIAMYVYMTIVDQTETSWKLRDIGSGNVQSQHVV